MRGVCRIDREMEDGEPLAKRIKEENESEHDIEPAWTASDDPGNSSNSLIYLNTCKVVFKTFSNNFIDHHSLRDREIHGI